MLRRQSDTSFLYRTAGKRYEIPFIVKEILLRFKSTSKTFTFTISPTFKTSEGCLIYRSQI